MDTHSASHGLGSSSLLTAVIAQENAWDRALQPFPGELGWKKENCHTPAGHSPAHTEELHLLDEWKLLEYMILAQKIPRILPQTVLMKYVNNPIFIYFFS